MRFILSLTVFCFTAVLLAGCSGKPSPMARGYSSYDQEYKSVPGVKPHDVGYAYTNQDNATALKDMRFAARDLVEKLDEKLSFSVDEIYLKISENSAFYTSFDHLIRDELTQRGYLLSNTPVNTVTLDFVAIDGVPECFAQTSEGDYQSVYLALAINAANEDARDNVGGFYEVPLYDFRNVNAMGVKMPECPVPLTNQEG